MAGRTHLLYLKRACRRGMVDEVTALMMMMDKVKREAIYLIFMLLVLVAV